MCPLCGKEDGGHHAVSACERLSSAVTLRHNDAGTAIVEAIAQGSKGGHLISTDVGWQCRHQGDEQLPPAACTRYIPVDALPCTIPVKMRQQLAKQSIPDAMLYTCEGGTREYTIVEIKYCRDTRPDEQRARASAQHQALKEAIETHDPHAKVTLVPLMLGVSGVIYKTMVSAMEEKLGVKGAHLRTLLKRLHYIAIEGLEKIWQQRWAMILSGQHSNDICKTNSARANEYKNPRPPCVAGGAHTITTDKWTRRKWVEEAKRKAGQPRQGQG